MSFLAAAQAILLSTFGFEFFSGRGSPDIIGTILSGRDVLAVSARRERASPLCYQSAGADPRRAHRCWCPADCADAQPVRSCCAATASRRASLNSANDFDEHRRGHLRAAGCRAGCVSSTSRPNDWLNLNHRPRCSKRVEIGLLAVYEAHCNLPIDVITPPEPKAEYLKWCRNFGYHFVILRRKWVRQFRHACRPTSWIPADRSLRASMPA